jgi:SAM-dependent methyltransferase
LERRRTFDTVAALYATHRPGPPDEALEAIATLGARPPARLLEIACGPGTVTLPLAQRGYRIHAVELGENLAAIARERLKGFPVSIEVRAFEEARLEAAAFDLCVCSSAFHWLDRPAAYAQIAHALRPGGSLAIFWTARDRAADDGGVFLALQEVYARLVPELMEDGRAEARPKEVRDVLGAELVATGNFEAPVQRRFMVRREYDARGYVALLGTYSDHIALPAARREALFRAIVEVINQRFGGRAVVPFATDFQIACRR